jgi:endonuclease/exonuclease/phosphatase family metal-dependent hydrolase
MRKIHLLKLIILSSFFGALFANGDDLRIMTYNIKYANENKGEEWSIRKHHVAEMIRFHKPHIIGLQEALRIQIDFLDEALADYKWIGHGRDDGQDRGEFSPIFFSDRFELINAETFWLSLTPSIPSKGWDAAFNRIVTCAKLLDTKTGDTLAVFNTHFDHLGIIARKESALLLIEKLANSNEYYPLVLMGDFNVTDSSEVYEIINDSYLNDAQMTSKFVNYGTAITYNGFVHNSTQGRKIDYIFVNNRIEVIHHAIIGDKFDGKYPSDHMPVITDIVYNE